MTALSQDRNTPERDGLTFSHPVAANARIYGGALVMLDASGNAAGATTATGRVRRGVFRFANHATDKIDRSHLGDTAWAVDDQTVAASSGTNTRSACGTIRDVDAQGVWIEI